jgi:hypothetical protein
MYGNAIKESTATAGTGTMTLSQVAGFERFSDVFSTNDLVYYCIEDGTSREWGIGTVGASNTLARTTILEKLVAGTRSLSPGTGITLSGAATVFCDTVFQSLVNPRNGADVASATTTSIWTKDGDVIDVTGTVTITSLGTADRAGQRKVVRFTGALTLTNGANLIIPGSANITTANGDWMEVVAVTTTQHAVVFYQKANGNSIVSALLLSGGTMTGNIQMNNNVITGMKSAYYNTEYDAGNSGSALTIDWANGARQKCTLNTATPALTINDPPGVGHWQLKLIQDGTGGRLPTWAGTNYSASRWIGATAAPTPNTAVSGETIADFYFDGTKLYQSMGKVGA